jgi:hypothetical protein
MGFRLWASRAGLRVLTALTLACCAVVMAQDERLPSARLVPAPRFVVPGAVDSNIPMVWDLVDGRPNLFAMASWGGIPALFAGSEMARLQPMPDVSVVPHPGWGIWIEAIIPDDQGTWYGYYHHEVPAEMCGSSDRAIPRIASARSTDHGLTWEDLGPILEAPPDGYSCASTNRFVVGGVGDLSAMLDPESEDLILFFSMYSIDPAAQGVAVARLRWADRDRPGGRVMVWQKGVWLPARRVEGATADDAERWEYPNGTPLVHVTKPWHDGDMAADAFWGPSVHWNTHLQRYVMLLNRTKDESFNNEGIYVSYARTLENPDEWSTPRKIMNGGGWYPQVAGLEAGEGTDKQAGARGRFFTTGRSEYYIELRW